MTGETPLCLCDAFPDPHPHGHIAGVVYCEMLLTGPRVSPHLFPSTAIPPEASRAVIHAAPNETGSDS